MKKQTLIYLGLVAGLINVVWWIIFQSLFQREDSDFSSGELLGYTSMLLALSLVFFGVKRYRDTAMGGKITFVQAFFNGLIVVLVASFIYVIGWEIYYPNFATDFSTQYADYLIETYEAEGLSKQEIQMKKEEMDLWIDRYEKPLYRIPITLMEILPLGLVICLVSALTLKRK